MGDKIKKEFKPEDFIKGAPTEHWFEFTLVGTEPLKLHNFRDEDIEQVLVRGERPAPIKDMPLPDMAERCLYLDEEDNPAIPVVNLMAALRDAGRKVPWGKASGRQKVTMSDGKTLLFSFLKVYGSMLKNGQRSQFIRLDVTPGEEDNEHGWHADLSLGRMPNGTAVGIVRPQFDNWQLKTVVCIRDIGPEVTAQMVGELFGIAGQANGLGAHRPSCGGPFGAFKIAEVIKLDSPPEDIKNLEKTGTDG